VRAVNLIPSEQRSGGTVGARSEGAAFAVLVLLAGVAILTLLYGLAHHQLSSRRAEAAALTARAQQVQAQAASLTPYTSFISMREQRLQAISQLIGSRFDWSAAMGELSRVLPSNVALSTFQGAVGSATGTLAASSTSSSSSSSSASAGTASVSSATPPGTTPTFTLTGCAASQAVVAQTLVRMHLINGVSNVTLQSSTKSSSSASGGSSGSCPSGDPVFTVQLSFQPLPAAPSVDTEKLESTVSASAGAGSQQGTGRNAVSNPGAAR
jgi:Tfp pilus assembly protein PilN